MDEEELDGTVIVYFPIEGEPYYLALLVNTEPKVSTRFAGIDAGVSVYLKITLFNEVC